MTEQPTPYEPPGGEPPARRRRRPLRAALISLAALTVAGAGGAAATGVLGTDGAEAGQAAPSGPAKTATVERTTLTRTETVDGTLGYGETTSVQAAPGGGSSDSGTPQQEDADASAAATGILTQLPGEGQTIERGETVYSVNEERVPLLYGSTPLYRELADGSEGKDVTVLEKNLAALGYSGFTADDTFTEGTADAVRAWQEDLGREETGTVRPGDAVVAPAARRVAEVKAVIGTTPSGEILTWTGTRRTVTVDLDVSLEDLVRKGTPATVRLPDGTETEAKVSDIGNAATAKPEEGSDSEDATLPVELTVKDQKKLGRYQAAPVDVTLGAEEHADVLAVPVQALVARPDGGYAVQAVASDGTVSSKPVTLGMFAGGLVEVSGEGITEGLVVGVPK
ncbi:peptidoglycan-binding protein [Streptomyces sp. NPDC051940]|uniref:peptidoglycan-binding protein n=1 Tax=Streptomyces sp. NPDC051940 TaxID=3155675 RepID=UPI003440B42C